MEYYHQILARHMFCRHRYLISLVPWILVEFQHIRHEYLLVFSSSWFSDYCRVDSLHKSLIFNTNKKVIVSTYVIQLVFTFNIPFSTHKRKKNKKNRIGWTQQQYICCMIKDLKKQKQNTNYCVFRFTWSGCVCCCCCYR